MAKPVAKARCPNPKHRGSHVTAHGPYTNASGTVQRYLCDPGVGKPHTFSVGIEGGRRVKGQQGAPVCPAHPGSRIRRHGPYAGKATTERQRYRCTHTGACNDTCATGCDLTHDHVRPCARPCRGKHDCGGGACPRSCDQEHDHVVVCANRCKGLHADPCTFACRSDCDLPHAHLRACRLPCPGFHTFTPVIPREHVHLGDQCADCLELRGIHRGELAVARFHRLAARQTVRLLSEMSTGLSYGKAGKRARALIELEMGKPLPANRRKRPIGPPKPKTRTSTRRSRPHTPSSRLANRFWHLAADLVEAFSPVIWADTESTLRDRAAANRAAGHDLVWLLDDVPIYATDDAGKRKKTDGYSILALAELDFLDPLNPGASKLRLVRALPKTTGIAWRLVFDEMGYVPDVIVSDASTAIKAAVEDHFGTPGPIFIPSVWHIRRALTNNALKHALKSPARKDIERHLALLSRDGALSSVEAWFEWWEDLPKIAGPLVVAADLGRSVKDYRDRMARAIGRLAEEPLLRVSTGGMESLIRNHVEPVLHERAFQFANIERTNNLFDLVVVQANGGFTDLNRLARLIETDETPHGGWTVPIRAIADPQPPNDRYRSLRDEAQMRAVAASKGIW